MFSRFDTIPVVIDSQPATQPRRRSIYRAYYVARVKMNCGRNWKKTEESSPICCCIALRI